MHFLGAVDGELEADAATRRRVCEVMRAVRPDVVLGHDPWKQYRLHPDHRHAGQLVIDGIVAARDPHFFPDAGVAAPAVAAPALRSQVVDHVEPVDDDAVTAKIDALLCHRSQWRSTMGIDEGSPDADAQRAAFVDRGARRDRPRPAGEAFKRIAEL